MWEDFGFPFKNVSELATSTLAGVINPDCVSLSIDSFEDKYWTSFSAKSFCADFLQTAQPDVSIGTMLPLLPLGKFMISQLKSATSRYFGTSQRPERCIASCFCKNIWAIVALALCDFFGATLYLFLRSA